MFHHVRVRISQLLLPLSETVRVRNFSKLQVSVISNGGFSTPKSILVKVVHAEKQEKQCIDGRYYTPKNYKSYLFNCGEGTKRIYSISKHKKNAIEDIFITVTNWENLGGLKGLFTERVKYFEGEFFRKELKLYGPELMLDRFYVGKAPVYSLVNATMDSFHEDEHVQIKFIPFFPELSDEDFKGYPPSVIDETKNWKIEGVQPKMKRRMSSIVYILKLRGENNTQPAIMILDCPDKRYLSSLLESEDLKKYQSAQGTYVFHLSPTSVVEDPRYKTFIDRFHSSNEHIHVKETQEQPFHYPISTIQTALNELDNHVFPLLPSSANRNEHKYTVLRSKMNKDKVLSMTSGKTLEFANNSVKMINNFRDVAVSYKNGIQKLQNADEKYLGSVKEFVKKQKRDKVVYPVITFLGTGATTSTLLRNVTGIYLEIDPDAAILLDCGEGTFMQMYHHFGSETSKMLRKLKCIFISHLHADHIVGLASILKQRHLAFKEIGVPVEPVDIIGEDDMTSLIYTIEYFVPNILQETVLHVSRNFRSKRYMSEIHTKLNLQELTTVKALHNFGRAHSVSIKHDSGWHLVFSGDTMPSDSLIRLGFRCDILIHEATFSTQAAAGAKKSHHSTVEEAVTTSKRMKAKKTILTHFSPQTLLDEKKLILSQTDLTIAMDHMRLQRSDLEYTPLFNPFLLELSNYTFYRWR
ncbi:zinc phosphodiesterase ELAC protein 2-like [Ylistrum balloti]|uniref:zinc phosphodiesterase ELAC protein 2-like n=1 Tax=Ylistrum balloti TaxID=509963 RepID=UPI002905DAC7|nr:zinc phosphodiesterase ELAC protein 2-like [Ylistrum balloti]